MTLIYTHMEPSSGRVVFMSDCLLTRDTKGEGEVLPAPMHYSPMEPLTGVGQVKAQSKSILVGEHLLFQWAGSWLRARLIHRDLVKAYASNPALTAREYHDLICTKHSAEDLSDTSFILTTLHGSSVQLAPFDCIRGEKDCQIVVMAGSGTAAITDDKGFYENRSPSWNPDGDSRRLGAPIHEVMNRIASLNTFEMTSREHFGYLRTGFWYEMLSAREGRIVRRPYSFSSWFFEGEKISRITSTVQYEGDWGVVYRIMPPTDQDITAKHWQFSIGMTPPTPAKVNAHELFRRPVDYSVHAVQVGSRFSVVILEGETFRWRSENGQHFYEENGKHILEIQEEAATLAGM